MTSTSPHLSAQALPRSRSYSPHAELPIPEGGDMDDRSVISSRMTDVDENDDLHAIEPALTSNRNSARSSYPVGRPFTRISVGEQIDVTTRPNTSTSNNNSILFSQSQPSRSRQGIHGSLRGRPTSPVSRTHVPSLTSSAFYHPMSSTKLQAQRGKHMDDGENSIRTSSENTGALRSQNATPRPIIHQQPQPSTSQKLSLDVPRSEDGHNQGYAGRALSVSPTGQTMKSVTSASPLHATERGTRFNNFDGSGRRTRSQRSSMSINGAEMEEKYAGKNYQFFPGNTLFCLGGRWQTAKDLPMNILTSFLVVIPSGLFFGFS